MPTRTARMAKVAEYLAPGETSPAAMPAALVQRRTVLVAALAVFVIAFLLFSGGAWAVAVQGLMTDGGLAVLWLLSAAGIGSLVPMPRRREGEAPAEPRATTASTPSPRT